jgi:hypothetical protein
MPDLERIRREGMRWNIISAMNKNRPYVTGEHFLLEIMQAIYPGATLHEVRRELDYLDERNLVKLDKKPSGIWFADLSRYGIDIAEYTIDCHEGVARPPRYGIE